MKARIILFIIFNLSVVNLFGQTTNINSKVELTKNETNSSDFKDKYKQAQKEKKKQRKALNGNVIKDLVFEDIEGNKHTLESFKGKVVVLNFWFIQCKPCVEEFPDLNKLKAEFNTKPVEFFAVAWNSKESLEKFLKTKKIDLTVVPSGMSLIKKFKIPHYPYNIIIDQNGKVEYVNDVLSFNVINKMKRKIKTLLK